MSQVESSDCQQGGVRRKLNHLNVSIIVSQVESSDCQQGGVRRKLNHLNVSNMVPEVESKIVSNILESEFRPSDFQKHGSSGCQQHGVGSVSNMETRIVSMNCSKCFG